MLPNGSRQQSFDELFTRWANAALIDGGYTRRTIPSPDRIPSTVKKKVVELWEMGIIRPDRNEAYFCIADRKNGNGSRYKWFTCKEQGIFPNLEYFVQLAGFRDLMIDYGYPQEWLKFEYREPNKCGNISVDIGIITMKTQKIFVEVKTTDAKIRELISQVIHIGKKGNHDNLIVDTDAANRARCIIACNPDYFAGYSPSGFDAYTVNYRGTCVFSFDKTPLPRGD